MIFDHYCPDMQSCGIEYTGCPALVRNGTHTKCDVFKASHYFQTATDLLKETSNENVSNSQIKPDLINEKLSGLELIDMPDEIKVGMYKTIWNMRMAARETSTKAISGGCRMNKYIRTLQVAENIFTQQLHDLESEGFGPKSNEELRCYVYACEEGEKAAV